MDDKINLIFRNLKSISTNNPNILETTQIFEYYLKMKVINIYKLIIFYDDVINYCNNPNNTNIDNEDMYMLLSLLIELKI